MNTITTISEKYFSLNGINFAKIYQPLKQGSENIGIYNIYDLRQQLLSSTRFDEIEIDGIVYGSQSETLANLLSVVYESRLSSSASILIEGKTDKGGYSGTTQDLKNELDARSFEGVLTYQSLVDLQAVDPVPDDGTAAKVVNDSNSLNNGNYSVVSGVWVIDSFQVENIIEESNTTSAVTGAAVYSEDEKIRVVLEGVQKGLLYDEVETILGFVNTSASGTGTSNTTWVEATPYLGFTIDEVSFKVTSNGASVSIKVYSRNETTGLLTLEQKINLAGTYDVGVHTVSVNISNTYGLYVGHYISSGVSTYAGVSGAGYYAAAGDVDNFTDTSITSQSTRLGIEYRGRASKLDVLEGVNEDLNDINENLEGIYTFGYYSWQTSLPSSALVVAVSGGNWILGEAAVERTILQDFRLSTFLTAGLNISVLTFSKAGDVFTVKTRTDFVSVVGLNIMPLGVVLDAGDYVGVYTPPNSFQYNGSGLSTFPTYYSGQNLSVGNSFTDSSASNFAFPFQINKSVLKVDSLEERVEVLEGGQNGTKGLPFDFNLILGVGQSLMEGSYTSGLASQTPITTVQEYNTIGFKGRVNLNAVNPATVSTTQIGSRGEWSGLGCAAYLKQLISEEKGIDPNSGNVIVLTNEGSSGAPIDQISKGGSRGTFELGITKAGQLAALTSENSGAIAEIFMQGEANQAGDLESYKDLLNTLIEDYANDLRVATGQTLKPKLYSYQLSTFRPMALAHYEASEENPNMILACPMYQFSYYDSLHIDAQSERLVGAYFAKAIYDTVVNGVSFEPLKPLSVDFYGNKIVITFNKKGLYLDEVLIPLQTDYGFNFSGGNITGVSIKNRSQVVLTVDSLPQVGDVVGYGNSILNSSPQAGFSGNLRDNNGVVNVFDGFPLHNWCVLFDYEF
jgi:hypothetical protein